MQSVDGCVFARVCAVMCTHSCILLIFSSAVAAWYHSNLCTPAGSHYNRNNMTLDRDAADSSVKRSHPSLMKEPWREGGRARLAVWQAAFQLINISATHHQHHCVLLYRDVAQSLSVLPVQN